MLSKATGVISLSHFVLIWMVLTLAKGHKLSRKQNPFDMSLVHY